MKSGCRAVGVQVDISNQNLERGCALNWGETKRFQHRVKLIGIYFQLVETNCFQPRVKLMSFQTDELSN